MNDGYALSFTIYTMTSANEIIAPTHALRANNGSRYQQLEFVIIIELGREMVFVGQLFVEFGQALLLDIL